MAAIRHIFDIIESNEVAFYDIIQINIVSLHIIQSKVVAVSAIIMILYDLLVVWPSVHCEALAKSKSLIMSPCTCHFCERKIP